MSVVVRDGGGRIRLQTRTKFSLGGLKTMASEQLRSTITVADLVSQTHQEANDGFDHDSYWLGTDGDIIPATFLLGDLCTWDFEREGYRLMRDQRKPRH